MSPFCFSTPNKMITKAEFRVKVMINQKKTKVLFAEVGSDFADVLLSFLTLPLGEIVRAMNKHYGSNAPVLGSLTTLYKGVKNLNSFFFSSEGAKQMLLNPRSWFNNGYRKLKLSLTESQPDRYFMCDDRHCLKKEVEIYYGTASCICGRVLSKKIKCHKRSNSTDCSNGVLTAEAASFIIFDDMQIFPVKSFVETQSILGNKDTEDAELRIVTIGLNEIMDLLKGMFLSTTPLTDVILKNKQRENLELEPGKIMKVEPGKIMKVVNNASNSSKKMILKFNVHRYTNKLLFAEAEQNFVDFLFTLLTIPLGGVESLLGMDASLKSIDNFYASLMGSSVRKYLKTEDKESMLLNPKIPYGYLGQDMILPLTEDAAPKPDFPFSFSKHDYYPFSKDAISSMKSPKGDSYYVKGPRMYMVTDDLTVTPFCMSETMFGLERYNIPRSDVDVRVFHIGPEEALSILKASLTSTRVLTDGILKKFV